MIFDFLIDLVYKFFTGVFDYIGFVQLSDIPVIGDTVSSTLLIMITTYNAFVDTLPYAGIAMNVFLYVIVPFEVTMFVIKLLLGSRTPSHTY